MAWQGSKDLPGFGNPAGLPGKDLPGLGDLEGLAAKIFYRVKWHS